MRTLTVCTLALLVLPPLCLGSCSDIPNLNTIRQMGSSLGTGHTFKVFSTPDLLVCMEWCHRLSMCHSVDLNRERSECRLNVKSSIQDPSLLRATNGSIHVDKEKFPELVFDACRTHTCENKTMCVSGGCIPVLEKTCGLPPTVANAELSPPGPFPVGHTHNYKCTVEYLPFYEPYTTCQDDGKWTDVVFECIHQCIASGNTIVGSSWCYFFGNAFKVTYNGAKNQCAARGMVVPIIETQQEWQAVVPHLVDFRGYWIGARAEYSPWPARAWKWYNGKPVSYQPWKPGQPDNLWLNQMNVQAGNRGWDDENDSAARYFMCEINF